MKYIFLFILTFLGLNSSIAQSKSLSAFDEKHDCLTLYFYQSMIRMLNVNKNEDFNKLVKHLEYIECSVHLSPNDTVIADFKNLSGQLLSEGLTEFFSFEKPGDFIKIFQPENEKNLGNWVLLFYSDNRLGFLQVEGKLDANYLSSLYFMNINDFVEDFDFEKFQNWE